MAASGYQQGIVARYWEHLDTIMLNKLSELVSDLYLADSESKEKRLWAKAEKAMVRLKVPPAIIEHIVAKRDVQVLAKNLDDWLRQAKK